MKKYTKAELELIYESRRTALFNYMKEHNITAAVFEDTEGRRNPAIRYFTGHPTDALWVCASNGKNVLCPWDENLAKQMAVNVKIIPSSKYDRITTKAVYEILKSFKLKGKLKLDLPPETPYPLFLKYLTELDGWDILCREESVHDFVVKQRTCKDEYEIECTKEAARIGNIIIEEIEKGIKDKSIKTESDVALFIEKECRKHGCECTGFDTLAAGPERSYAIHAFPGYTDKCWPGKGLSILDFGVVYQGYTSDTTVTVVCEPSHEQEELVSLVEKAYSECLELYKPDIQIKQAAALANSIFAKAKRTMPHTLGHGIGLEIHEFPRVSSNQKDDVYFKPGMIVTLEPGLYDENLGGVRFENDILITENGNEVISNSKIIRL